ncbi:MAG TPA: hypothetical protein VEJ63_04205 [Planctomycetota bacterium]|nr:hypothetical protein [Planctomycetota bacterium]
MPATEWPGAAWLSALDILSRWDVTTHPDRVGAIEAALAKLMASTNQLKRNAVATRINFMPPQIRLPLAKKALADVELRWHVLVDSGTRFYLLDKEAWREHSCRRRTIRTLTSNARRQDCFFKAGTNTRVR